MSRFSSNEIEYYVALAARSPELDAEQEARLARRYRDHGDRRAADALVRAHLRQVVMLALKYRRYGVPVGDLVAEGNFGLVLALRKFDPERGVRFGSYAAYWLRAQMLYHVIKSWTAVSGASGPMRSQLFFKLRRERARITAALGTGEAAEQALAEKLGLPLEKVRAMTNRLESRDVSLDARTSPEATTLLERLEHPDDQERTLLDHRLQHHLKHAVEAAVARLDPRERAILEQRLMADPEEEQSLQAIGRSMNVSRERARQLEFRTKRKLRDWILGANDAVVSEWIDLELGSTRRASDRPSASSVKLSA